jgi:hypothetical protein
MLFSPDGTRLYMFFQSKNLIVIHSATGNLINTLSNIVNDIDCSQSACQMRFSESGTKIYIVGSDTSLNNAVVALLDPNNLSSWPVSKWSFSMKTFKITAIGVVCNAVMIGGVYDAIKIGYLNV